MSFATQELAAAQGALLALYAANTQSLSVQDRSRHYLDIKDLQSRVDMLTWQVAREQNGNFFASQFRPPE